MEKAFFCKFLQKTPRQYLFWRKYIGSYALRDRVIQASLSQGKVFGLLRIDLVNCSSRDGFEDLR